jgi:asparagine synthase (glutamine-hydrolysing)
VFGISAVMNVFAGVVRFDGARADRRIEEKLSQIVAVPGGDRVEILHDDGALFAQRIVSPARRPQSSISHGRPMFVGAARLDNCAELNAALGIVPVEAGENSQLAVLARLLERWGDEGIARCVGAFAFARWEVGPRRLTLGRDCLGYQPLFFHRGRDFVAFATTLNMLLAMPGVPRELDEIVLASFLVLNLRERRRTFYRGIERVPSRTLVTIDARGVSHRYYWAPKLDSAPLYRRDRDYIDRARELFDQAVTSATAGTDRVAIATSGGLDSSAVAATVARLGRVKRIECYSLVAPAGTEIEIEPSKYADERAKVEALGRMYPALDIHFLAPQGPHRIEEDDTLHFAKTSLPVLNPASVGLLGFLGDAVIAAGHRRLLMGTRGNFGLSWVGDYSLLALLQGGQWGAFAHELKAVARNSGRGLSRTIARDVVLRAAPQAMRRPINRFLGHDPDGVARYSGINPDFIAAHDLFSVWRCEGFDPLFAFAAQPPAAVRAHLLFDFNLFGRDRTGLDLRGYEIREPHTDRRLLEFLLTVPERLYRRDGVPRSFARAVLADRLPDEILSERRRGRQDVNWFQRLEKNKETLAAAIERLEGSPTARRLLDLPRLNGLLRQWPADRHAAQKRALEFELTLTRAVHVGNFIRWVEGGNA